MKKRYSIEFMRDEVARIIQGSLVIRRASLLPDRYDSNIPLLDTDPATWDHTDPVVQHLVSPPTESEIDEFIAQCPFDEDFQGDEFQIDFTNILLGHEKQTYIELDDDEFFLFQKSVTDWSGVNAWLGADDWPLIYNGKIIFSSEFAALRQTRYNKQQLAIPEIRIGISHLSPSFKIIEQLIQNRINIEALGWREFEELIAELLSNDGYSVELGPGRSDGGVDIVATKNLREVGSFKTIWQAKKLRQGKKVGLSLIRELADTRLEQKASKGIIVTTTFLTSGALERVKRDEYSLGKVDRNDLQKWIERIIRNR